MAHADMCGVIAEAVERVVAGAKSEVRDDPVFGHAVEAGGHGAEIASNTVGPGGGAVLVERTLDALEELWR